MSVTINGTTGIAGVDGSASTPAYQGADTNTGIAFPAADTVSVATGGTERMRVDSSGNVGIGGTVDNHGGYARCLQVTGTEAALELESSSGYSYVAQNGTSLQIRNVANGDMPFYTNNTERMRIDSSGNLLVGTTTAPNIAGAIHVSNASGHGLQITNTSGPSNRRIYMASGGNLYFWNGSNEGYLSSAGAWTNASDARLKTNIRDIEYGLETVISTQPRHFERVDVEGTHIGFIAQELQQVIPEVVSGDPERQLGVDYGSLVAVAFKAIQELSAKNDALEARIAALEAQP